MEKFRLGDMTASAFAQTAPLNPVILLPLGSQEDHGPHLPMGDYLLADILAERIAASSSTTGVLAFSAPCLPFGAADYFGSSPGGLALSSNSFQAVLSDLIAGLTRHGLTKIIILNGHGGNVPLIHEVTLRLRREAGLLIPSFYLWKIARQLMERQLGDGRGNRFGHGAEPLLSLTQALRGDTLDPEILELGSEKRMLGLPVSGFGTVDFHGIGIDVPAEFDDAPRDAIPAGWPLASAELGQDVANQLVETAVKFVAHFTQSAG
jgi:creatinine amidohydrolase